MSKRRGFTVWFTGMSSSGKSTIGRAVAEALQARGRSVELLDSGRIRKAINRTLGFSREEVEVNLLRLGYECSLLNRNGVVAIVTAISPYADSRALVRAEVSDFVEVFCRCPIDVLESRGARVLFNKARRGEIAHVAGVNSPFEEPPDPDVVLDTDRHNVAACCRKVIAALEQRNLIGPEEPASYTPQEEQMIRDRLQDLGYL